jgi:hypothetical protein
MNAFVQYNTFMSLFGSPKEIPASNAGAIKFAIETGLTLKATHGDEIAQLFLAGYGPLQIVDELQLRREFPLASDKTIANAVSNALEGYAGDSLFSKSPAYTGLLSEETYKKMQNQQHSGRVRSAQMNRWENDPQRWTDAEIGLAKSLAADPTYLKPRSAFHRASPDYERIATELNHEYHNSEPRRTANSVEVTLAKRKQQQ